MKNTPAPRGGGGGGTIKGEYNGPAVPRKPAGFEPDPDPVSAAQQLSRAWPGRGRAFEDLALHYYSYIFRTGPATKIYIELGISSFYLLPSASYPNSKSPRSSSFCQLFILINSEVSFLNRNSGSSNLDLYQAPKRSKQRFATR